MWRFLEPSYPYRETVIVNLKSGKAFRGVLWQRTGSFVVLKNAELLRQREQPLALDGDTLVPFGDVEFMQVVHQVKAE
jgi:small nuclear ribonucleoprotein (snRNP)-like protein